MRVSQDLFTIFSAKDAAGTGNSMQIDSAKFVLLEFGTATSASLTVKFQGSVSDTAPTFSSAQSATNHWDYVDVIDLEDGASIDGDTGVSPAGTDDFRLFQLNNDGLKWLCATITTRTAGSLTLKARAIME